MKPEPLKGLVFKGELHNADDSCVIEATWFKKEDVRSAVEWCFNELKTRAVVDLERLKREAFEDVME